MDHCQRHLFLSAEETPKHGEIYRIESLCYFVSRSESQGSAMNTPPIEHKLFDINKNKVPTLSTNLKCPNVAFAYYDGCDPLLIAAYATCAELYCGKNYPESTVLIYPGTMAKIGDQESVFGIAEKVMFAPGIVYKGCPNKKCYRDVVARAELIHRLASFPRVIKGQKPVNTKTVVSVVEELFGEDIAAEVKMYFEFL